MQLVRGFFLIILISFIGEILKFIIPLPVPASIYGFVILILLLHFKIIDVKRIKTISDFLLNILPITFIGPGAGLIVSVEEVRSMAIPIILGATVGTVAVMGISGVISEKVIKKLSDKKLKDGKRNV